MFNLKKNNSFLQKLPTTVKVDNVLLPFVISIAIMTKEILIVMELQRLLVSKPIQNIHDINDMLYRCYFSFCIHLLVTFCWYLLVTISRRHFVHIQHYIYIKLRRF